MLSREDNELLVRVGPGTPMGNMFRRFWLPVALASEVGGPDSEPVKVEALGESFVLFRNTDGELGLLDAFCTHRRAHLFWGRNEQNGLRCVYHGWKFDKNGECVDVPNCPEGERIKKSVGTRAFPVMERGGMIWAYFGPKELQPKPPATEIFDAPDSHRFIRKMVIKGNWLQHMEGDVDSSHISFLHSGLTGALPGSAINPAAFEDKAPRWIIKQMDYGVRLAAQRNSGPDHYSWRINQWLFPFATLIASPQNWPFTANIRLPVDDETTIQFRVWTNPDQPLTEEQLKIANAGVIFPEMIPGTFEPKANKSNNYLIDREDQKLRTYTGIKAIPSQDLAVIQDQGYGHIADRSLEKLTSSDLAIIQIRKRLLDNVKALMDGQEPPEPKNMEAYRVRPIDFVLPRDVDLDDGERELMQKRAAE